MITLPPGLVSTRYPGYFWSISEKKLFSIKSGLLKEVKYKKGFRHIKPGYTVSHNGIRRKFTLEYLQKLKYPDKVEVYPYAKSV